MLSDGRGVYQGREGEIIEGRYRILQIGIESIDLAYLDGRGVKPSDKRDNNAPNETTDQSLCALSRPCVCSPDVPPARAFRRGEDRARVADWDAAVTYYRQAVQADPGKAEYRIALERAMLNASRVHLIPRANSRRRISSTPRWSNTGVSSNSIRATPKPSTRSCQLEKIIRDRIEAARPKVHSRSFENRRAQPATPLLNPASRAPFDYDFKAASLRDILTFLSNATGINVIYDASFQDRQVTDPLSGSIEQALNSLLSSNEFVLHSARPAHHRRRAGYGTEPSQIRAASRADAADFVRRRHRDRADADGDHQNHHRRHHSSGDCSQQDEQYDYGSRNTAGRSMSSKQLVLSNDKPRAEITLDVKILEVSRSRTKELGLNLTQHQLGGIFSPDQAPAGSAGAASGATGTTDTRPFNLNTISQGVNTGDFYLTVPQAIIKFLATDARTTLSDRDAATRLGGRPAHSQGWRRRALSSDVVFANRRRRRECQPAVVVHLPHRWHQRDRDAAPRHR